MPQRFLYALLFILLPQGLCSQNAYQTSQLNVNDGLPSNFVYTSFQDSKGFLWFGTNKGVSKYDGQHFINYSLAYNSVSKITEDRSGNIWFIGFNKVCYHNGEQIVYPKFNSDLQQKSKTRRIIDLSFDLDSIKILTTGDNYSSTLKDSIVYISNSPESNSLNTFKSDIYFQCNKGKYPITRTHPSYLLSPTACFKVIPISVNEYLLFHANTIYSFKNNELSILKALPFQIRDIIIGTNNKILVATEKGAFILQDENYTNATIILSSNYNTSSLLQDHEGGLWITTFENGVFYIPNLTVKKFDLNLNDSEVIKKVVGDSSCIYLFTSKNSILTYQNNLFSIAYSSDNMIRDMALDHRGDLHAIIHHEHLRNITQSSIHDFKCSGRQLVFGHDNKPYWTSHIGVISEDFRSSDYGYKENTYAIQNGAGKSFLLGTTNGLWQFNYQDTSFVNLSIQKPLLSYEFTNIHRFNDSTYFLSSPNGIVVWKNDTCFSINESNGLTSNACLHSIYDQDSILWVSTNKGLSKITSLFDIKNRRTEQITVTNGLCSDMVYNTYITGDMIWVATSEGVNYFKKDEFIQGGKPFLYLDKIEINNTHKELQNNYSLAYHQNNIKIELAGISLGKHNQVRFQYRLDTSASWKTTTNDYLFFSSLAPGEYQLQVKAIDRLGNSSPVQSVSFDISYPFWREAWFYLSIITFVLTSISLIVHVRLKRMRNRQLLMDELFTSKQKALSSQMNPHFIFNSLNAIQRFVLKNDKKSSNKYLSHFATLMRLVLDNSQSKLIPFGQELEALKVYLDLESLRLNEKLEYEIQVPEEIENDTTIKIPPLLLQPYVENAIWHGIMNKKGKGKIVISATLNNNRVLCCIQDDGVGRKKTMELKEKNKYRKSLGNSITAKRIELANKVFNQTIEVNIIDLISPEGSALGTKVELTIPKLISHK